MKILFFIKIRNRDKNMLAFCISVYLCCCKMYRAILKTFKAKNAYNGNRKKKLGAILKKITWSKNVEKSVFSSYKRVKS